MKNVNLHDCFKVEARLQNQIYCKNLPTHHCLMDNFFVWYAYSKLFIYDLEKKTTITKDPYPKNVEVITQSLSNSILIMCPCKKTVIDLWNLKTWKKIKSIKLPKNFIIHEIISTNDHTIVVVSQTEVLIYDTNKDKKTIFCYYLVDNQGGDPIFQNLFVEKINESLIMIYHRINVDLRFYPSTFIINWEIGRVVTILDNFYYMMRKDIDNLSPFIDCNNGRVYTNKYNPNFINKIKGKIIYDVCSYNHPTLIDKDVNNVLNKISPSQQLTIIPIVFLDRFAIYFDSHKLIILDIKQEKNIYESPLKESMEIIIRQIIWNNYIFIIDMRTIFVYKVDYQKINEYLLDYLKNLNEKE